MPHSVETATAYVIAALEDKGTATRDDFDVHGIVSATHRLAETWDFRSVDRGRFWSIAATFLKP
ncbi:hypothetical protein OHB26_19815 [Nocardia sp. NBC_01503]|uniref:hypothetical protein n=1 Tax=Nocardia sp. NBC_01503 TaxID=2975997 RepID=UPI002E7B091C|nr:hypothetical protein [Nocardia sp. NBC_01503]WTL29264.1 hypothetical protein OHB26_19815 [Nocardia sp. NBC_01503]